MNAITQENNQAMLQDHYNQANQAFQDGNYALALSELQQAMQYAENEKQAAHIEQSIRTVQEMMSQEPTPPAAQSPEAPVQEPSSGGSAASPNKMLLLTVLVGLICLTPIIMKCIEIFTQPAQVEQQAASPAPASPAADPNASGATVANTVPASPASTPDVIVEANATAEATVTGSGINLRESASTKANSLVRLSAGEKVKVLEANAAQADGYVWSKIETSSGASGWVAAQFLRMEQPAQPVAEAPASAAAPATAETVATTPESAALAPESGVPASAAMTRSIVGSGVSLRSQPGTKAVLITTLSQSQITVLENKAMQADGFTWTKIRTANGTEGWVADQFLSP